MELRHAFLAIALTPLAALATTCGSLPLCVISAHDVLFIGTVLDSNPEAHTVRFQIVENFKGLPAGTKEITAFGDNYLRGHDYLVDGTLENGTIRISGCGRARRIEDAKDSIAFLRAWKNGTAPTTLDVLAGMGNDFIPNLDIHLTTAEGKTLTIPTDENGRAHFDNLTPGRYQVTSPLKPPTTVSLELPRGVCTTTLLRYAAEGSVRGVVRDHKGLPVANLQLELVAVPPNASDELSISTNYHTIETDDDGHFDFTEVTPGQYYLGANLLGLGFAPIPRIFYPNAHSRAGAFPVDVKGSSPIENLVIQLPDFGSERPIRLCAIDANGKPIEGASFLYDPTGDHGRANLAGVLKTDSTGCLTATGYSKLDYSVVPFVRKPPARPLKGATISIPTGDAPFQATAVLDRK